MIVYLDNEAANMHLYVGRFCENPVVDAIAHAVDIEYYEGTEFVTGWILEEDHKIPVNFDGNVITHTAKEWSDIYDGITNKIFVIGQSEY